MSTISEYNVCSDVTAACCAPSRLLPGRPAVCTQQGSNTYCAVTCTGAPDCVTIEQLANYPAGRLSCTTLTNGSRACLLSEQATQQCMSTLGPFAACSAGGNDQCCGYDRGGVATICSTTTTGLSYCAPRCMSNADCDRSSGRMGSFVCGARNDGLRVCFPR